ncbi:TonB-dependent receptor plug domain-containing protein [Thermodesulfobacteriota bacterium]
MQTIKRKIKFEKVCLFIIAPMLLVLLVAQQASGAEVAIQVLEKGSGVPVEGAMVVIEPTETYEISDQEGYVRFIDSVRPLKIKILAVGHETFSRELRGERNLYRVYIEPVIVEGEGLEVVAERIEEKVSKISLNKQELLQAPGSQGDPLKTITSLPGVVSASDGTGVVYMRGSGANDNIVWVDRTPVGYLYHWGGIQSTINPALVEDFNVFLGGFPVEYGDSLGGVIDVRLRSPRTDRMHYSADISTYASSVLLEGPVGSAGGEDSFFLAGRRSYVDLLFSPSDFNEAFTDQEEDENPDMITRVPQFYDFQAIYNRQLNSGNVKLYLLGAGDVVAMELNDSAKSDPHLQGDLDATSSYQTIGMNWQQSWSEDLDQTTVLAYFNAKDEIYIGQDDSGEPFFIKSETNRLLLQPEWHWKVHAGHRIDPGIALDYFEIPLDLYISRPPTEDDIDYDFTALEKYRLKETLYAYGMSPYVKQRFQWTERLATVLGLRYTDITVSGGYSSRDFSPRGAVEYQLTPDTLLTASWGKYVQLPQGGTLLEGFGNPGLGITQAEHRILGVQHQFTPLYSMKTEIYHKVMTDLVVPVDANSPPDNYANQGEGEAWGIDFFLKRKQSERKMGWLSFSYGKSERTNRITDVTRDFSGDQPLTLTIVWGQPFPGRMHKWLWSFRFQAHSGAPYTRVTGRHREDPADPDSRWIPEYGEHNGERTPMYYKLDLRIDREFLYNRWKMKFYVDLQNATFHQNIQAYDYGAEYEDIDDPTPITGMSLFPFFGVEANF